ncbi:MAG: hypothetical protein Q9228_004825 [Teloschistes exilis]
MSSLFPSPSAHAAGADMSQNSAPQKPEGSPSLDRGDNASPSNMTQYHSHGPPLPPHLGGEYSLSTPPNDHPPQQLDDRPHLSRENSSVAMKSDVKNSKGPHKNPTPAPSPDAQPASSGRRRARTKVVAWDKNDLADIYHKKEVLKYDWDAICRVSRSCLTDAWMISLPLIGLPDKNQSRHATTGDSTMKMRDRNKRQMGILPNKDGKSSKNSDSSRPVSNGIKWASVNGDQSSHADAEESSDDVYAFSSGAESEVEKKGKYYDPRSRSTSRQTRAQSMTDTATHQQLHLAPQMPLIIQQEAPHVNGQTPNDFDLFAAQSRGKQIAPRQAPLSATPFGPSATDDGRIPPPDHHPATSRNKRAREIEDTNFDPQIFSTFVAKRRKQPSEQAKNSTMQNVSPGEGYVPPFNPAVGSFNLPPVAMPSIPPPPPPSTQEVEIEDWFGQFRDRFRTMKAGMDEFCRESIEVHQAATGRANTRARQAEVHTDEMSKKWAAQAKEKDMLQRIERESMEKQLMVERAENQALREKLNKLREKLLAADQALEHEKNAKADGHATLEEHQARTSNGAALATNHLATNQDFGNVNDTSAAKAKDLEAECKVLHEKLHQIKEHHNHVKFTIEDLVSKDLEDLTHKIIKKRIANIKDDQQEGAQLITECERFLYGSKYLAVTDTITNGSGADGHMQH